MKKKSGFAFIEFDSYKTAKKVIQEYNNKNIMDYQINLCWPKQNIRKVEETDKKEGEEEDHNPSIYYTVRFIFNYNYYLLRFMLEI